MFQGFKLCAFGLFSLYTGVLFAECVWYGFLFCVLVYYVMGNVQSEPELGAGVPTPDGCLCEVIMFLQLIQLTRSRLQEFLCVTFVGHCPSWQKRLQVQLQLPLT